MIVIAQFNVCNIFVGQCAITFFRAAYSHQLPYGRKEPSPMAKTMPMALARLSSVSKGVKVPSLSR